MTDQLRQAWTLEPVRSGLLGTLLIVVGSLTPAFLPQAYPLWPALRAIGLGTLAGRTICTILGVAGIFLLVQAWLQLRDHVFGEVKPLAIVALWSLPFVLAPPIFSHDVYSYAAQGWMLHNGQNPYEGGPGQVPGPFTDYAPWVWRYTPTPYGPLALQISRLVVDLSGGRPWLAALLMRVPALVGVVVIVVLLPRIAGIIGANRDKMSWFACLNPLLIVNYAGGGHNDAWMMGLVVVALWMAVRWARLWPAAAVIVGVAASIKQPAMLAAVFLPWLMAGFSWRDIRVAAKAVAKAAASLVIGVATFAGISWACRLGYGWVDALSVPGNASSISPSYWIGRLLQVVFDPGGSFWMVEATTLGLGGAAIIIAVLAWRLGPAQPLRALSWAWITVALAISALHSWYLLWGGLLLPASTGRKQVPWVAVVMVCLLLGYTGVNLGFRSGLVPTIAASVCTAAWMAYAGWSYRLWSPGSWGS